MGNKENLNCIPLSILEDRATPTANEIELLIEWSEKFRTAFAGIDEEIKNSIKDAEEDSIKTLKEILNEKTYERAIELNKIATHIVTRYYDSFNGDYDAILELTKSKVESTLNEAYIAVKVYSNYDESKHKSENELFQEMQTLLEDFNPQSADIEPVLTIDAAKAGVRANLQDAINYLIDNSSEHATQLIQYIDKVIASSPLVYRQGEEPARSEELGADIESGISSHIRQPLPIIKSFGLMNDKVVNRISSGDLAEQKTPEGALIYRAGINQAQAGQKKVVVDLKLAFEGDNTELSRPVNDYDIAVYNAVSTAFFYHSAKNPGKPLYITPQEIWRTMNGIQDAKKNPSFSQVQAVCDSVDKMRSTFARMDITQELQAFKRNYKDSRIKSGLIETYLLNASKATFATEKGNTVTGYRVLEEPVLYTYNKENEHLIFIPIELLDTSATTRNEAYVTNFRQYLLRQIENMYSGERDSKRILFNTVYKSTGITPPELRPDPNAYKSEKDYNAKINKERKKDKDKIFSILESFRIKDYIKDFAPVKNGRTFTGVDIVLFEEKIKKKKKKK